MKHHLSNLIKFAALCLSLASFCWFAPPGRAATYDISIDDIGFNPDYLEVELGDTVNWWNDDPFGDPHTTRSYSYPWSSGLIPAGRGVYLVTDQVGTFDYIDEMTGATGTLVVKTVTPPQPLSAPQLTDPTRFADGTFQCMVSNLVAGETYRIEACADLASWNSIYTNTASGSIELYTDSTSVGVPTRFYRAVGMQ